MTPAARREASYLGYDMHFGSRKAVAIAYQMWAQQKFDLYQRMLWAAEENARLRARLAYEWEQVVDKYREARLAYEYYLESPTA